MATRQKQTLMDYMVIGISPALIMALVGSLLFFLLTVFYHGQYDGRLMFIFAMFVMAIVLIARISMEEGIEYATLFAIPLGLVTAIAMMRFVRIEGQLANFSIVINLGLMALVWWSAHKLTWDCTLIDDRQDASGEGLLQGMGFEQDPIEDRGSHASGETANDPHETNKQTGKQDHVPVWWQRMVDRRHRPHTPGVWVVYYSIAALGLFGLGQLLIPASNPAARLSAFQYLFVYVASALGLLLTTSFLGLRRYLRQRGLQMPSDMAGMWLGIGAIMIVVLLLFCVVLPRPGAEVEVSQLPFTFGSPDHRRTHQEAKGNDGPQQPEQATSVSEDAEQTGPRAPQQQDAGKPGAADQQDSSTQRAPEKSSPQNPSGQQPQSPDSSQSQPSSEMRLQSSPDLQSSSDSQQQPKDTGPARRDGERSQQERSQPNGEANQPNSQQGQSQSQGTRTKEQRGERSGDQRSTPNEPPSSPQTGQQQTGQQQPGQQNTQPQHAGERRQAEATKSSDTNSRPAQRDNQRQQGASPKNQPDRDSSGTTFKRDSDQSSTASGSAPSKQSSPPSSRSSSSSSSVTRLFSGLASSLGTLLKLLLWGVLLGVLIYFTWKYRDRVLQAIRQLLEDLRNFWAALFGGRQDRAGRSDAAASIQNAPPPRPFASYADPFASGQAAQYSTEQLIRHSFEAMEAWARERACPRTQEQTPLEFARHVALEHPGLGMEAQTLADLYSRVAYGHQRIAAERRSVLEQLWRHMRSTAAMPAPPTR